jgi:hypothetical protein
MHDVSQPHEFAQLSFVDKWREDVPLKIKMREQAVDVFLNKERLEAIYKSCEARLNSAPAI